MKKITDSTLASNSNIQLSVLPSAVN